MIDLELVNETIVDHLFNIFEKNTSNIYSQDFEDQINKTFDNNNIRVESELYSGQKVQANTELFDGKERKIYIIKLLIPQNSKRTDQELNDEITRTLIHEISHILTHYKIPDFVDKRFPGSLYNIVQKFNTEKIRKYTYNLQNYKLSDLNNYLEYVFHIREKSSFALSIALSCYFDDIRYHRTPEQLYVGDKEIVESYLNNRISFYTLNNYINQTHIGDTIELFLMQFAARALKKSDRTYKVYLSQLESFVALCGKYWKRLDKLFKGEIK